MTIVKCDNCEWVGVDDDMYLSDIDELHGRLDCGCPAPNGECPECFALCYDVSNHTIGPLSAVEAEAVVFAFDFYLETHEASKESNPEAYNSVGRLRDRLTASLSSEKSAKEQVMKCKPSDQNCTQP